MNATGNDYDDHVDNNESDNDMFSSSDTAVKTKLCFRSPRLMIFVRPSKAMPIKKSAKTTVS